ncbi:MAG: LysM peptidoglycan-binding domain-containing protein [Gammaproteobacteria bacterium]
MAKKIIYLMIMFFISSISWSADLKLRSDHPQQYVVKKGDTLWDISAVFLKSPWLWPEIWQVNPQIENPHLIYPGDVLELAFCDGKPCLKRAGNSGRTVKLSPNVRTSMNDHSIPAIPLDVIRPFLSRPRVVAGDTLELAPYVVASQDEHLIAGAENKVYIRGINENEQQHRYMIFRSGEVYRDAPVDEDDLGEVLGYEALYVADAEMQRFGDPSTALITLSKREVLIGDRLLPEEEPINEQFIPHVPDHEINGKIISVIDGVSQIGQYQIVVLNLGDEAGLEPGHVLSIHESGRLIRDPIAYEQQHFGLTEMIDLPEERIGELMVFRTFSKLSYALVMDLERPAHIYDAVHLP